MKRGVDNDSGDTPNSHKRPRAGDEELRFLIPRTVAGSIIGRGGFNIANLRSQYRATITVPDSFGPERILTVISDLENCMKVLGEMLPKFEETKVPKGGHDDLDLRMLVHQSQIGGIIGKGGTKIKELREKTEAKIKIYSTCCPSSTDRVISIGGDPDTVLKCIEELVNVINTQPISGQVSPYDPRNYDEFADEYGGFNNQPIKNSGGVGGGFSGGGGNRNSNPVPRGGMGLGAPNSNLGPRGGNTFGIAPLLQNYTPPPPMAPGNYGYDELRFLIPGAVAGSIIGRGGKNIANLRNQYKATITIPDTKGPERVLTIRTDIDSIMQILNDMIPKFEETRQGFAKDGEIDLRMLVHQSQVGGVIGNGGMKVRELRAKTGARIKIFSNCCPDSTDRVVSISGHAGRVMKCIWDVIGIIETAPLKGHSAPYDPRNPHEVHEDYGGFAELPPKGVRGKDSGNGESDGRGRDSNDKTGNGDYNDGDESGQHDGDSGEDDCHGNSGRNQDSGDEGN